MISQKKETAIFDGLNLKDHLVSWDDIDRDHCINCGAKWQFKEVYSKPDYYGFMDCIKGFHCETCGTIIIVEEYRVPEWHFDPIDDEQVEPDCSYCNDLGGDWKDDHASPCPFCGLT